MRREEMELLMGRCSCMEHEVEKYRFPAVKGICGNPAGYERESSAGRKGTGREGM